MAFSWSGFATGLADGGGRVLQGIERRQYAEQERQARERQEARQVAMDRRALEQETWLRGEKEKEMRMAEAQNMMKMGEGGYSRIDPAQSREMATLGPLASAAQAMGGQGAAMAPVVAYLASIGKQAQGNDGWAKTNYSTGEKATQTQLYRDQADREARAAEIQGQNTFTTERDKAKMVHDSTEAQKDRASRKAIADAGNTRRGTSSDFTAARQLRTEFTKEIAPHRDAASAYAEIAASVNAKPSAAGDVALVFKFMKSLDPNSTVREGEYATAKNAGSIPQSMRNSYNQAMNGQFLQPEQRKSMLSVAKQRIDALKPKADRILSQYENIALKYGMDPMDIVYDPYQTKDIPQTDTPRSQVVTPLMTPPPGAGKPRPPIGMFNR